MGLPAVVGTPAYNVIKGCPKKLTLEFKDAFCECVRQGMNHRAAALKCGLGRDTIQDWTANFKFNPNCPAEIIELFEEAEIARANMQSEMLQHIHDAAAADTKHWTAAAWILERTDPEQFGRNRDVTVRHENAAPAIQVNQVILGDAGAREASRDFLRGLTRSRTIESIGTRVGSESEEGEGPARS